MKFNLSFYKDRLKSKLWFNIFLRVSAVFAVFIIVLTVANVSFLSTFFCYRQKKLLASQIKRVSKLDINDKSVVSNTLSDINDSYNFDVEIYSANGKILYTTHGSQMMDFFIVGREDFSMSHDDLISYKTENLGDGIIFEEASRRFDKNRILLCRKELESGIFIEIRIQKALISSSAQTANEFIVYVACACFVLSVIWIFLFARKFTKPLSKMNEITADLSKLNFDRRLQINGNDEIAQLARSINEMSDSLNLALIDLKNSNAKLKDEIELERRLDVMRKAFIANVSHELKTPISVISGYAEGLKLNVNSDSREEYCDIIIDESQRMNRLVLSILELSRYESGQIPLNREVFDIGETVQSAVKRISAKGDFSANSKIPKNSLVYADVTQIERVLKAYLENAMSHVAKNGEISVFSAESDEKIRITVHNTGEKIDPEIMPHIWESFYRGDTSHKRDQSRVGLGLSIVSAVMKRHEENFGVYNTENGVCFWFELPKPKNEKN